MRGIFSIIGGVLIAISMSQFPEYSQQYEQRLGGALDELNAIVARFDQSAGEAGLSRQEALSILESDEDDFIIAQGTDMRQTVERQQKLDDHLSALQQGGPLSHLSAMARFFDNDIARRAWENFKPAVPTTIDGLLYTLAGFGLGYGLARLLIGAGGRAVRGLRRAKPATASDKRG